MKQERPCENKEIGVKMGLETYLNDCETLLQKKYGRECESGVFEVNRKALRPLGSKNGV